MADSRPGADDFAPMSGSTLWIAGSLLALANFMVVLDTTIANVSVPNIAGGLAVSPSQGTWVITSYAVAEAVTVPLTGWLANRFGAVKTFVAAMIGFGLFSALCGVAPSLGALVAFRIGQGLMGGPMMPLSQTLLRRIFPPRLQGAALGLWSMTTVVGPIAGPLLGGAICDDIGWPWVFYINVPIAAVAGFFAWRMLKPAETKVQRLPVDFVGLGLLILWIGAMQIMLDKGKDLDWFASPFILTLAIVAVLGFISFVIWEMTEAHPIVDLRIFRHRGFSASTVIMCLAFGAFFSSVVLIPLWLQTNMGYTAAWAGRVMAFQGVLAVVMSPIAAKLMGKVDPRALVSFGILVLASVTLWRAFFAPNIGFWGLAAPQLAMGFGMPFFFVPLTGLALGAVEPQETASAAGLMNFMRTTAGAFGTSLTTTAWENLAAARHSDISGALIAPQQTLNLFQGLGFNADQALQQLDGLVQSQSVMLATDKVFAICALVFCIASMSVWLAPKPRAAVDLSAGGH
ncbi:DHA2 family efflux MFS transporter permease subunit [Phenylobacterium montanum]|uniref:DHA2 family efflux MFS transporter permease subunit n=1 Tax=Phenylobacterium montanum TaxID=2823693 RepID=A0A975IUZ0_9CAUL|nr:DHA2 family efflux MFS transporter permease subunit [Caulobacter sp. S6]QUD88019.1 DHA2 family efflux MFS transporter permease subunit [Caulobacter sp. S6]